MPYEAITANDIFQCRKCGDCCRGYGGTYLADQDIIAIAEYLHMDPRRFLETYCVYSGSRPILSQREDGFCVFWDNLCLIHPVKPRMCKAWPFIESVLTDFENWEIMSAFCPGIRTGYPPEAIQTCIQKKLEKTGDRHF